MCVCVCVVATLPGLYDDDDDGVKKRTAEEEVAKGEGAPGVGDGASVGLGLLSEG